MPSRSILTSLVLALALNAAFAQAVNDSQGWKNVGPSDLYIGSLAGLPGLQGAVLVGWGGGLARSADQGISWQPSDQGIAPYSVSIYSIVADPTSLSVLYAAGGGIFRSADSGLSWTRLEPGIFCCGGELGHTGRVYSFAVDPSRPTVLYAGTLGPEKYQGLGASGVFKSSDGGATWARSVQGLPSPQMPSIWSLLVDAERPDTVYAATGSGVFKSIDAGISWNPGGFGDLQVNVLRAQPGSLALFAGLEGGGVFRSTDGGETWSSRSTGLPGAPVEDLLFNPRVEGEVYAATNGAGVFVSHDSGQSWSDFNEGLGILVFTRLAMDSSGSYLFAGSFGRGVWLREIRPDRLPIETSPTRPRSRVVRPHSIEAVPEKAPPQSRL